MAMDPLDPKSLIEAELTTMLGFNFNICMYFVD
jgi:hypothetical protein